MNHNLVTIEIPTFITVANIDAETDAQAVSIATQLIDQTSLIDRNPRDYSDELPAGSVISIETADSAISGRVTLLDSLNKPIFCTYEVSKNGEILPAQIPQRIDVVEAARHAMALLETAFNQSTDEIVRQSINSAYTVLFETGIANTPRTIVEQLAGDEDSTDPQDPDDEQNQPQVETLHSRIQKICQQDNPDRIYRFSAPIFLSPGSRQIDDDSDQSQEAETGWNIDFGEIAISQGQNKIGAIGTWKHFANKDIAYFDDPFDFDVAKLSILEFNDLKRFSTEKPDLPGNA
jgi:hypothetical protein